MIFFLPDASVSYEQMEPLMDSNLFVVAYKLHGELKSFIIRSKTMRNADAWHWASCDVGIAPSQSQAGFH